MDVIYADIQRKVVYNIIGFSELQVLAQAISDIQLLIHKKNMILYMKRTETNGSKCQSIKDGVKVTNERND